MHVGPYEIDFLGPSGIREVAVVDTSHNIIFLRIFGQSADDYGNTLLLAELNGAVLMARDMKVDQKSSKIYFVFMQLDINNIKATYIWFFKIIFQGHLLAQIQLL